METLIVHTASRSKLEALKAFLIALKIDFRQADEAEHGVVTNPETLRRIAAIESGQPGGVEKSMEELKAMLDA